MGKILESSLGIARMFQSSPINKLPSLHHDHHTIIFACVSSFYFYISSKIQLEDLLEVQISHDISTEAVARDHHRSRTPLHCFLLFVVLVILYTNVEKDDRSQKIHNRKENASLKKNALHSASTSPRPLFIFSDLITTFSIMR